MDGYKGHASLRRLEDISNSLNHSVATLVQLQARKPNYQSLSITKMAINTVDLRAPNRTLHVGVILPGGETEILDVAPIDYLSALTHRFIKDVPDELFSAEQKKEAIDVEFHYVTEKGEPARMTAGMRLMATVSSFTQSNGSSHCPWKDVR